MPGWQPCLLSAPPTEPSSLTTFGVRVSRWSVCLAARCGILTYLGNLGGLSALRRLVMLDLRGTGQLAVPADPASYRCDRLVDDVCALQDHLGLDRIDLLGHSAGANLAVQYAARCQRRVSKLVLLAPSTRAVGLEASSEMRREIVKLRRAGLWFAGAAAAFERIQAGAGSEE